MIDNKDIFEYEGYHFVPVKTIDSSKSFQYFSERIYSDKKLGMANYDFEWVKHPWNYEEFYKLATKPADIFLCYENGSFYLPGGNELFGWRDSPSEIKVNRYILDVILAVLSYHEFQKNHKILMEDKQYDISYMTREYYNSLDLPFGMKKNNLDFERVMSYAHDPCKLDKMKNSEFADLPKYIWKEDMKKTG